MNHMHAHLMRRWFLIITLCLAAVFALRAEEKPANPAAGIATAAESDFVRFREDAKGAQLQTAIATYRNPFGITVELIGAIHIADKAYYDTLNQRFTKCEAVLYEMVGEDLEPGEGGFRPRAAPANEADAERAARDRMKWLHPLYDTLKTTLNLSSQIEGIDYSKDNFVHADMTARQFATMQRERGEGFLQMWLRSVQVQISQPDAAPNSPGLLKILEILCRPDSPTELKRLLGRMFDKVEKLMAGMETEQGSVIVVERNKVALSVMKTEIARGLRHLGIFYGAAHLPDMEKRLLAMGYEKQKTEWLTAWDLPPEPPPPPPAKKATPVPAAPATKQEITQ
jgi:hypothetical protein